MYSFTTEVDLEIYDTSLTRLYDEYSENVKVKWCFSPIVRDWGVALEIYAPDQIVLICFSRFNEEGSLIEEVEIEVELTQIEIEQAVGNIDLSSVDLAPNCIGIDKNREATLYF